MRTVSTRDMVRVFGRIGLLSFGGPAAQIAVMHRELVEDRPWMTDKAFLDALGFCMLLPGPEAMQLATYCGWQKRGVQGGLIAGGLFVLPGALVIGLLALIYAWYGARPETGAILLGVKAAVIIILVQALLRLARKALVGPAARVLAVLAFVAIFALGLPFPVLIGLAGIYGWVTAPPPEETPAPWPRPAYLGRTIGVWLGLWLIPLAILAAMGQAFLFQMSVFFAKLAVVTFGGAYAVLAYMAQEVVQTRGWLDATQMLDALGLAETTPGPLILVTQFVGMLAGHGAGGVAMALVAGALTLWVTFVPCFLWIFAGAPFVDALTSRARPKAALRAISAAVVGVILNLSVWFALHVLFDDVTETQWGPLNLPIPQPGSLNPVALSLVALAAAVLIWAKRTPLVGIPVMAVAGGLVALI